MRRIGKILTTATILTTTMSAVLATPAMADRFDNDMGNRNRQSVVQICSSAGDIHLRGGNARIDNVSSSGRCHHGKRHHKHHHHRR